MIDEQENSVHLTINGNPVSVRKGQSVHDAAVKLGIKVPIFCYHDRMPPFGACRICLVEVDGNPKLQTSCTLIAQEGMVVKTESPSAVDGRSQIMELLLINHPLDCPVCDRGGECPLQEHALHHGCGESKFFEDKRRFKKPVSRGPLLMLDRERCIACARCTRFGELVAGDNALELIHRGFKTEVGTPDDGPVKSKFIGNTIMICPVGALTSQVYRFQSRPWDNETTKSTCTYCPVGCSLNLDARDGQIVRTRSFENKKVNDIWLCDKGWFGYEFSTHPERIQKPLIRKNNLLQEASWEEAFSLIAKKMTEAKPEGKLAGIGGEPLTIEENYLFQKLMREVAGVNHVDHRSSGPIIPLADEGLAPGMEMSLEEVEDLSYAVLFGIDLTEEFPVIWLRLKQAINKGAHVLFIGHFAPEIAKHLEQTILHAPGDELNALKTHASSLNSFIQNGKKGAFFVGRQYLATNARKTLLSELLKWRSQTSGLTLNILEGCGNSMGARYAGMHPELLPEGQVCQFQGFDTLKILKTASLQGFDFLYIAASNLSVQVPQKLWNQARSNIGFLVVQDLFLSETANQADVVLPTLSFLEKRGTFLNIEKRMQKIHPGKERPQNIYSDGEIFIRVAKEMGYSLELDQNFLKSLELERLPFEHPAEIKIQEIFDSPLAKEELAATFTPALFNQGTRMLHNTHLEQMIKEPSARIHPDEGEKRNIKNGDIRSVKTGDGLISLKIHFDPKVALQTIVLPLGFQKVPVHELGMHLLNGLRCTL